MWRRYPLVKDLLSPVSDNWKKISFILDHYRVKTLIHLIDIVCCILTIWLCFSLSGNLIWIARGNANWVMMQWIISRSFVVGYRKQWLSLLYHIVASTRMCIRCNCWGRRYDNVSEAKFSSIQCPAWSQSSQHGTFWEPSSLNSVILDRWRSIRVICPKRQHFYEGMTAVVTTRGLLRQGDFCDKLHLNPCLYSSLHIAPSCIK